MSKTTQAAAAQPALVEVTLDKPHNHKGKPYKAGDKINVTADQKTWLTQHGVISGKQEDVING